MVATKNRVAMMFVSLLTTVLFVTACSPPGPTALKNGKQHLDAGRTDEAISELKTAVTLMQTNATAWNYLGVAYHRGGQLTNAVDAYSRALRFNRELLEARFNLGCVLLDLNRTDAAKTEFTAYTLRRPNAIEGFLKLGATQMRTHDLAGAEKSFRDALRVNGDDAEALNAMGMVAAQLSRPRDAAESFAKALKQQPDSRAALLNLATVLHQQLNDRPEALKRYREYLALQPREADWETVNAIAKSLEPTPVAQVQTRPQPIVQPLAQPATKTNIAHTVVATTKPAPQTTVPKIAVTPPAPVAQAIQTPTTPPPAPEVVKVAPEIQIKTSPAAVTRTTASTNAPAKIVATTTAPTKNAKPEQKSLLSKLNPFKGDTKTNVPPSEPTSTPVQPTPSKADYRKTAEQALVNGQQLQRAGKLAEALQSYKRATQLDASYFEAQYCLGLAAFESRSFKVAASAWESALALRPDSADARYNLALTFKAEARNQDAADELEKLLTLHPDEARGHLTLGNLYAGQLLDVARARTHYTRVLQLDPRNPQAQAIRYWLVANPG